MRDEWNRWALEKNHLSRISGAMETGGFDIVRCGVHRRERFRTVDLSGETDDDGMGCEMNRKTRALEI